jgi:CO/xanthine dehydrogenase Mo-binding subunit
MTGLAVQEAVRDIKTQLRQLGAEMLGCTEQAIRIENGKVSDGRDAIGLGEIVSWYYGPPEQNDPTKDSAGVTSTIERKAHRVGNGDLVGRGVISPRFERGRLNLKPTFYEVAMGAAEIDLDRDTGVIRLLRYTALADAGKVLADPVVAKGQVEGAAMQGLGHSLSEELLFEDGQPLNGTLMEYRVPMAQDVTDSCECIFVENGDGPGPFGAKGMGQASIIPIASAISSAVTDATGAYLNKLPLTPERVWRALSTNQACQEESQ